MEICNAAILAYHRKLVNESSLMKARYFQLLWIEMVYILMQILSDHVYHVNFRKSMITNVFRFEDKF